MNYRTGREPTGGGKVVNEEGRRGPVTGRRTDVGNGLMSDRGEHSEYMISGARAQDEVDGKNTAVSVCKKSC